MRNKNLAVLISGILLNENPAVAMNEDVVEFSKKSQSPTIELIDLKKDSMSIDHSDLSAKKQKVSKTLPLNRRKSSGSPRTTSISAPKSISPKQTTAFLEDQRKSDEGKRKESLSSSPDEQKESPGHLQPAFENEKKEPSKLTIVHSKEEKQSQEGKKESSPRPGFKKYSLVGPIVHQQIPFPNSSQSEQTDSPGRDGAISPMRQSRDQVF